MDFKSNRANLSTPGSKSKKIIVLKIKIRHPNQNKHQSK